MSEHIDSVHIEIRSGTTVRTATVVPKSAAEGVVMSYDVGQDVADLPDVAFVRSVATGFNVALTAHGKAPDTAADIELTRARIETSRHTLARLLEDACPGPHLPRQHRDHRPPWCAAFGYTAAGERVKEIA